MSLRVFSDRKTYVLIDSSNIWHSAQSLLEQRIPLKSVGRDDGVSDLESSDTIRDQLFATFSWSHTKDEPLRVRVVWPKIIRFFTGILPENAEVWAFLSLPIGKLTEESKRKIVQKGKIISLGRLADVDIDEHLYKGLVYHSKFDCYNENGKQDKRDINLDIRPRDGKEKAVDVALCKKGFEIPIKSEVYIFSGDGDMIPLYESLLEKECIVHACSWSWSLAPAVSNLKGISLHIMDQYYFQVTKLIPHHEYISLRWFGTQKHPKVQRDEEYYEENKIVKLLLEDGTILPCSLYIKWNDDNGDIIFRFFVNSHFLVRKEIAHHDPAKAIRDKVRAKLTLDEHFGNIKLEDFEESKSNLEDDRDNAFEDVFDGISF